MSSTWELNLAALSQQHPALAHYCRTYAHRPTAIIAPGDPAPMLLDHLRTAAPRLVLQLGIDDGALARAALARADAPAQYAFVEPSLDTLCDYLAAVPLADLLGDPRVRCFVGTPADIATQWTVWLRTWPWLTMTTAVAVLTSARLCNSAPTYEPAMQQLWVDTVAQLQNNYIYHPADGYAGIDNTLTNLDRLATMPCLRDAAGCATQLPGIVIGAGPSLTAALPALRELQTHAILAASPSALPILLAAGIRPHLWVHVERLIEHAQLFSDLPTSDAHFFVGTAHVHPRCWTAQAGTPVWLPCQAGLGTWLTPEHPPPQIGQSSAHAAFSALATLGCPTLYLVGLDLAYHDEHSHADGAWLASQTASAAEDRIMIPGPDGRNVLSNALWLSFLHRFTQQLIPEFTGTVVHVINAHSGALINGTTRLDPAALSAQVPRSTIDPATLLRTHFSCSTATTTQRRTQWANQHAHTLAMLDAAAEWCQRAGVQLHQRYLERTRDAHESLETWQQFVRDAASVWHPRPALAPHLHPSYDQFLLPLLQGVQLRTLTQYHALQADSRTHRGARDRMHTLLCQLLSDEFFWIAQCRTRLSQITQASED